MRQLIALFLFAFLAYASAAEGPYDWNNFLTEVQTTCKDVEVRKERLEKNIASDPAVRATQFKEADQMKTQIILIQNMINYEYKYRDQLDQSQKTLLETWKNKALRLRQELADLLKKLQ